MKYKRRTKFQIILDDILEEMGVNLKISTKNQLLEFVVKLWEENKKLEEQARTLSDNLLEEIGK